MKKLLKKTTETIVNIFNKPTIVPETKTYFEMVSLDIATSYLSSFYHGQF